MTPLLLLLAPLLSAESLCGPEECGLTCPAGEVCVQDTEVSRPVREVLHSPDQISCCCPPCCPQWSCQRDLTTTEAPGCPDSRPELGSPCTDQGLHCDYGRQECCGQWYPEISMECQGTWQGYYVDTLCILGLAPPCPDDTTTTDRPL